MEKSLIDCKYINLSNDVRVTVVDTYYDNMSSQWVAKIEEETGEVDTIPVDEVTGDDYCFIPDTS